MSNTCFIVCGFTGENVSWNVAVFTDREEADEWRDLCAERVDVLLKRKHLVTEYLRRLTQMIDKFTKEHENYLQYDWRSMDSHTVDHLLAPIRKEAVQRALLFVNHELNPYDPHMNLEHDCNFKYIVQEITLNPQVKEE